MEDEMSDWRTEQEPVYLLYEDDGDDSGEKRYVPPIRRAKDAETKLTTEEECLLIEKQVEKSKGFDIDFKMFRCVFNYQPVPLDSEYGEFLSYTTARDLVDSLSKEALDGFNSKYSTKYEFVKAIKANYHTYAGLLFYITFEGKLHSDNYSKEFQARVWYGCSGTDVFSCDIKPPQKQVHSIEAPEKEDPKKPRLTEEPSDV